MSNLFQRIRNTLKRRNFEFGDIFWVKQDDKLIPLMFILKKRNRIYGLTMDVSHKPVNNDEELKQYNNFPQTLSILKTVKKSSIELKSDFRLQESDLSFICKKVMMNQKELLQFTDLSMYITFYHYGDIVSYKDKQYVVKNEIDEKVYIIPKVEDRRVIDEFGLSYIVKPNELQFIKRLPKKSLIDIKNKMYNQHTYFDTINDEYLFKIGDLVTDGHHKYVVKKIKKGKLLLINYFPSKNKEICIIRNVKLGDVVERDDIFNFKFIKSINKKVLSDYDNYLSQSNSLENKDTKENVKILEKPKDKKNSTKIKNKTLEIKQATDNSKDNDLDKTNDSTLTRYEVGSIVSISDQPYVVVKINKKDLKLYNQKTKEVKIIKKKPLKVVGEVTKEVVDEIVKSFDKE